MAAENTEAAPGANRAASKNSIQHGYSTKTKRLEAAEVRAAARGQWPGILSSLAPDLAPAIERGPSRHGPCPVHGGVDGFRVFRDWPETGGAVCNTCGIYADGFALLRWLHGYGFVQCLRDVAGYLGLEGSTGWGAFPGRALVEPPSPPKEAADDPQAVERIRRTLSASEPLNFKSHAAARKYMQARGLAGILDDDRPRLRYAPRLPYWQAPIEPSGKPVLLGRFPALLAPVETLSGDLVSLHRTYLRADGSGKLDAKVAGKAAKIEAKKMMQPTRDGATAGAAIRLYPATHRLALTEGIETALSVRIATGWPVWACMNAHGLAAVKLSDETREIAVWGDNDESGTGQRAAYSLADRLAAEGRNVRVLIPPHPGADWLDILDVGAQ